MNIFFGNEATSVIKGLDNVRMQIYVDELPEEVKSLYSIHQNTPLIILGVQFSPDYVMNKNEPTIQYKGENNLYKNGLGEQILHIASKYIHNRWPTVDTKKEPYFFNSLKHLNFNIKRNEKLIILKQHIKNKKNRFAIALALAFSKLRQDIAAELLSEVGISLDASAFEEQVGPTNILMELYVYIILRLTTLTKHCVICDNEIEVPFVQGKPTLCTKFKCQFDYVELGKCSTISMTIWYV